MALIPHLKALGRADAWQNILTGLGRTERDKRLHSTVLEPPTNVNEDIYEALYAGDDVAARAAELPPREMTRQWIEVTVDNETDSADSSSRTEDMEGATNAAKAMMGRLEEIAAQATVFEAMVWARVHGGALVQLIVDDGRESAEPLDEEQIRSFLGLRVWTRWQVRPTTFYSDPDDLLLFGKPELYRVYRSDHPRSDQAFGQMEIHESRLLRFDGVKTTPRRRRKQEGWSDSIYARLESVIRDYSTAHEGVAHVLQDWGQFVYRMKGLANMLSQEGGDKQVIDRMMTIDMARSVVRAILLDADNESAERMVTPMGGIDAVMDRLAQRLAQAAEVPLTLLLGQSPAGLSATGESDIRFFYDQIKARQELELRPQLEKLVRVIFKSADGPTRGKEPEGWGFAFVALWQMGEDQAAGMRKAQAETDQIYISNGVVTEDEIAVSRFGGDRYSTETSLDLEARAEGLSAEDLVRASLEADPAAEPEPEPEPTAAAPEPEAKSEAEPVVEPTQALNGAQVTALIQLVTSVSAGELTYESALEIMVTAFPIDRDRATRILSGSEDLRPPAEAEPKPEPERTDTIEKRGGKYVVLSKAGEVLGEHDTAVEANEQLRAVEAAKAER